MNKTKIAALFAAGAIAGALPGQLVNALEPKPIVQLVNMKLVREDLSDAGHRWNVRACGYETLDSIRINEPCWHAVIESDASTAALEAAVLHQQK